MTTGLDLLNAALLFQGEFYNQGPGRTNPDSGYADCSGLIVKALRVSGIEPGGYVSTTIERWAVGNGGQYVDRDFALSHPGVGLTIGGRSQGWIGLGNSGHIEMSAEAGSGKSYGTPNAGHMVGYGPFDGDGWSDFFTFPGIDYEGDDMPSGGEIRELVKEAMLDEIMHNGDYRGVFQSLASYGAAEAIQKDAGTKLALARVFLDSLKSPEGQQILKAALS